MLCLFWNIENFIYQRLLLKNNWKIVQNFICDFVTPLFAPNEYYCTIIDDQNNDIFFCSGADIFSDCVVAGKKYTGTRNYTEKGVACQAWASDTPHKITPCTTCLR